MKTAIATTTIHVPHILGLLHKHDPDVGIFVAGDLKTPEPQCADFVNTLGPDAYYLSVEKQKSLGYACSDLIGWSCIQRRNIAMLEALKWGADIVVLWDDDNLPMNSAYFGDFYDNFDLPFNGLRAIGMNGWFDGAANLIAGAPRHRGFPREMQSENVITHVVNAKIGVAAGLCLGDPDVDATYRMEHRPDCRQTNALADAGIVVDPKTSWTVFNSQNTAFIRELAPAAFLMPGLGRYDDIWMSLIMQRVMRDRGYHVHFGRPYIFQQRNAHDLMRDLCTEVYGMERTAGFAAFLDGIASEDVGVAEQVRIIAEHMKYTSIVPDKARLALTAWLEDIEKVL